MIISFGTPSPTLGVSTILSIYVNPALNCSYQPTYCSAHRFPSGYISLDSNLCSRWRDPSLSLRPSGPGNILLPAPRLWPPAKNSRNIVTPPTLEQRHQADFNLTPDIFAKSGHQVLYEVELCHNQGIIWAASDSLSLSLSLSLLCSITSKLCLCVTSLSRALIPHLLGHTSNEHLPHILKIGESGHSTNKCHISGTEIPSTDS